MKILVHEWVTGGGLAGSPLPEGLAREGQAMRQAVAADFRAVDGVDVVVTLDERFAETADAWEGRVVLVGPRDEEQALRTLAAECDHTILIAPETGGVLADRADLIEGVGKNTLGSTSAAIAMTGDKLILAEHLHARGIPTSPTIRFSPGGRGYPGPFPAVVKPADGAGSEEAYFVADRAGFAAVDAPKRRMIVQPFRAGEAMSASVLVGSDGEVHVLAVGWQNVVIREGRFQYEGGRLPGPRERAFGAPADAVRSVAGVRGFVGVDFVWDEATGSAEVIEINPRVTTSYVGLCRYFGPGVVARAWLGVVGGTVGAAVFRDLRSKSVCAGLRFLADGQCTTYKPEVE